MNLGTFGYPQNAGCGESLLTWTCSRVNNSMIALYMNGSRIAIISNFVMRSSFIKISIGDNTHLEQPDDSAMLDQKELHEFVNGSFRSVFDMCRIGKLRLPHRETYLRKRTNVLTTSGYMDYHLHQKFCKGEHEHEPIQGTMKHEGKRVNMSSYAAAYTSTLGTM